VDVWSIAIYVNGIAARRLHLQWRVAVDASILAQVVKEDPSLRGGLDG
jgi:hypothetical protein